jgi:hypothetical protein
MSRNIFCDFNGKHMQILWGIVIDIKHSGKYSNQWDLKGFTNIYIT